MIKKLLILFTIIATSTMLQAHCNTCGTGSMKINDKKTYSDKKEYVETKVESLSKDLNLSKKQQKKLGKILKERKKELKEVRKKYRDEIKEILTEDQIKTFENIIIDSHH